MGVKTIMSDVLSTIVAGFLPLCIVYPLPLLFGAHVETF